MVLVNELSKTVGQLRKAGDIALTRDLAQPLVVAGGVVDLDEDLRVVSAGKGRADTFQIGAQQPYVNHGSSG